MGVRETVPGKDAGLGKRACEIQVRKLAGLLRPSEARAAGTWEIVIH